VFVLYRILMLGIGCLCFWRLGSTPGPDFPRAFYAALAAFLAWVLVSIGAGPGWDPSAWSLWYHHLILAIFFLGLARFAARQSEDWRRTLLAVLAGAALVQLGIEAAGLREGLGGFANRNYLGTYMLVGFGSAFGILLGGPTRRWRLAGALAGLALLCGITLTSSRGATLAALGVVALGLAAHKGRQLALTLGALTALVLVAGALANPDLVRKFSDTGQIDPYNYDRVRIWSGAIGMILENPATGVGPGLFEDNARRFGFPVDGAIGRYMMRANVAHSEYLQYAAESGVLPALLVAGLIASFVIGVFRAVGRAAPGAATSEWAAMLAVTGVALHALVDNVWTAPVLATLLPTAALASSRLTRVHALPALRSRSSRAWVWIGVSAILIVSTLVPGLAYAANERALAHYDAGRMEEAVSAQRFAVALWPADAQMLTNLGTYYTVWSDQTGDRHALDMGGAYFQRAIEARPQSLPAREGYAGTILRRLGLDPAADQAVHESLIPVYEGMLGIDPFLPFVTYNLAEAYYRTGREAKASELMERAVRMEPNYVDGYLRLADWREAEGRTEESEHFRGRAASTVVKYRDTSPLTPYEAMLLGRAGSRPGH
jgi:O-antigen ligase